MTVIEQTTELISSLKRLSGAGICFYDLERYFNYNNLGVQENRGHYCAFCRAVRCLKGGRAACDGCDRGEAIDFARQYRRAFFYRCHMGMQELILPLFHKENLVGLVFLGQCRIEGEDAEPRVRARTEALGGNAEYLASLCRELPEIHREQLLDMSQILTGYFDLLIERLGADALMAHAVQESPADMPRQLADYIRLNYMRPITPRGLSAMVYLSQSYVGREFRREMGMTLTDYIRRVRIDAAKELLAASRIPISDIAATVGFPDANYFSRVFRQTENMSPEAYRKSSSMQ